MQKITRLRGITSRVFLTILPLVIFTTSHAIDNAHHYKAPYFHATKSWKSKSWLSSIDIHYAKGNTHQAWNNNGKKTNPFQMYGQHNLLYLTSNVPQPTNLSATVAGYVNAMDTKRTAFETDNPADKQAFGCVDFCGESKVDELVFNYRQNLISEFFLELNIPIRRITNGPMTLVDHSLEGSDADPDYTQHDPDWMNFKNNLNQILAGYGFNGYACQSKNTNIGDLAVLLGWQHNFPGAKVFFEYLKLGIKGGVLFPTGAHKKNSYPFSFPTGYNGHFGIPIRADLIFGLSNDIYLGAYLGFLFFSSKNHANYPVKTDPKQNGFIKLFRAYATEKKGTLFDVGTYLKLDHFFQGLSALIGYSYNKQAADSLTFVNECTQTTEVLINNDCTIKNWRQHVLHLMAEYDFGIHTFFKSRSWKPRISIFYDHPFSGNRALINPMLGGSIGFDLSLFF